MKLFFLLYEFGKRRAKNKNKALCVYTTMSSNNMINNFFFSNIKETNFGIERTMVFKIFYKIFNKILNLDFFYL